MVPIDAAAADGVDEEPFREYAASLYRKAIADGKLAGLKLVLAEKRVAEVEGDAGAAQQKAEPAEEESPAKGEVAEKPRGEDAKPTVRASASARLTAISLLPQPASPKNA